jgi:hypothetical protein
MSQENVEIMQDHIEAFLERRAEVFRSLIPAP